MPEPSRSRSSTRRAESGGAPPAPATDAGRAVSIPEEVARDIEERIRGSGFASVDAFVGYVLARLLESTSEVPFSEEDERRLRERLRSLGYID
jgi:hypothetical protein